MLRATWVPSFAGAPVPVIPGYTDEGRQYFFRGRAEVGQYRFELPDNPRNRRTLSALPAAFLVDEFTVDPREGVRAKLRELGIPHRKNERLDTLLRKLPHEPAGHSELG